MAAFSTISNMVKARGHFGITSRHFSSFKRPDLAPVVTGGSSILPPSTKPVGGPLKPHKAPRSKQIVFSKKPFGGSEFLEVSESNDDTAECRRKNGDGGDDAEEVGRQLLQQTPLKMARQTGPWPSWCAAVSRKV